MATGATPKTLTLPYTGKEFLASLDDGREVWIYGERVKNITTHPAFQNSEDRAAWTRSGGSSS